MDREAPLPTVLVAGVARDRAALYRAWLQETYRVHTVTSGETLIETLYDGVDIVLISWDFLEMTGTALPDVLRTQEMGCRVVVTDTPADCERLPRAVDAHLEVPTERSELIETLEQLLDISGYDALNGQLSALRVHRHVRQMETQASELAADDLFRALTEQVAALETELAVIRGSLTSNRGIVEDDGSA